MSNRLPFALGAALVAVALVAIMLTGRTPEVRAGCSTDPFVPHVTTDKLDYFPGQPVHIAGCGFQAYAGQTLPVVITRPDASTDAFGAGIDGAGGFVHTHWKALTAGKYLIEVLNPSQSAVLASVSFTDSAVNLDQCANGNPATLACNWQNGNINNSNSQYTEGQYIPYRSSSAA